MIAEKIKWSQSKESARFSGTLLQILVRHSSCGRYHIATLPNGGFQFRESTPRGTFPIIIIQRFDRLNDAKEFAAEQEHNRLIVWHYFVELGERNKSAADEWVANPTPTCGISEDSMRRDSKLDLSEVIENSYSYHKYRAFLRNDPESYCWESFTDPAAKRDWEARLNQTYVQYWNKK